MSALPRVMFRLPPEWQAELEITAIFTGKTSSTFMADSLQELRQVEQNFAKGRRTIYVSPDGERTSVLSRASRESVPLGKYLDFCTFTLEAELEPEVVGWLEYTTRHDRLGRMINAVGQTALLVGRQIVEKQIWGGNFIVECA